MLGPAAGPARWPSAGPAPPTSPEAIERLRAAGLLRSDGRAWRSPGGALRAERGPARAHGVRVSDRGRPAPRRPRGRRVRLKPRQELILRTVDRGAHRHRACRSAARTSPGREGIDFASSTVRYELARLEELGFLDHPHTSAGRVPTDRGYRYYVDTLLTRDPPAQPPAVVETALDLSEVQREVDEALTPARRRRGPGDQPPRHRHRAAAAVVHGAPRRGAAAPAPARDGGGHHLDGRGHQAGVRVRAARSTRACASGPAPSSTSALAGLAVGRADDRVAARRPLAVGDASGRSWTVLAPALTELEDGGAAQHLRRAAGRASWPSSATWT